VTSLTKFDEMHCHKWALLLRARQEKMDQTLDAIAEENFVQAKSLFSEVFHGVSEGRHADPGMEGSLLYHMAMVTKMAAKTRFLLEELRVESPDVDEQLWRFYGDFASDAAALTKAIEQLKVDPKAVVQEALGTDEKIALFRSLAERTTEVEAKLDNEDLGAAEDFERLFREWAKCVVEMCLRQEYETIKSLLITAELAKAAGVSQLQDAMRKVQEKFGEETVRIALNVTLKVGMKREKLQSIMLSDHFINYKMDMAKLGGHIQFLYCPIFGSHKYLAEQSGINDALATLFCMHFCYAHAQAMLETVLPFTFALSQPQRMATHGKCEFYFKLAHSPRATAAEKFVPLVVSWNITRKCQLEMSSLLHKRHQGGT
jgi:hypothetical protein